MSLKGKTPENLMFTGVLRVVAEQGFEPRQTESESVVLPLHHSAMKALNKTEFRLGQDGSADLMLARASRARSRAWAWSTMGAGYALGGVTLSQGAWIS
jgi:hypothetical protein